eukprot:209542_1
MQQNAIDIKSQRQQRITTNEKQQKIEEDNKDKEIIFSALSRIRERGITDTNEFTWEIMYYENKNNNNNDNDEKENENKKANKNNKISQLINLNYNKMCQYGHGNFGVKKQNIRDSKCMCGSMNE